MTLQQAETSLIRDIAPGDQMHGYAPDWYFAAGRSAIENIDLALRAAKVKEPQRVLDFACGYGRVLRWLAAVYPNAELTACDVNVRAIDYCARTFGARPVQSDLDTAKIGLGGQFDLIWSGSLLTHVGAKPWKDILDLFVSALAPGGVLVFTTMGRIVVDKRLRVGDRLSFTPEQAEQVLSDYDQTGFGFAPSVLPKYEWGDCVASPPWVCSQIERTSLRLVLYTEGGWGERPDEWAQDVVAATLPRPN